MSKTMIPQNYEKRNDTIMNTTSIQNTQLSAAQVLHQRGLKEKTEKAEEQAAASPSQRLTQDTYVPSQPFAVEETAEETTSSTTTETAGATSTETNTQADASTETDATTDVDKSEETTSTDKVSKEEDYYNTNRDLIQQLKQDQAELKIDFLMNISNMFTQQGISMARGDGIWAQIANGDFEVTEAESAEAAKSIEDDGYWGVEQTSQRIFDFAMGLTGGDPSKAEEMKEYMLKGYEAAEKAWGGELPAIAQQTKEATIALFDEWANSAGVTVEDNG